MASIYSKEHRDREEEKWEWLPLYNYSDCFAGTVEYDGLEFFEYRSETTACGKRQAALTVWERQPNYVPFIHLASPKWTNVQREAVAWIPEPLEDWAVPSDCGDWPCTGMKNVVIYVSGSKEHPDAVEGSGGVWSGLRAGGQPFTITAGPYTYGDRATHTADVIGGQPGGTGSSGFVGACELQSEWGPAPAGAYFCSGDRRFGLLLFESLDADKADRSI